MRFFFWYFEGEKNKLGDESCLSLIDGGWDKVEINTDWGKSAFSALLVCAGSDSVEPGKNSCKTLTNTARSDTVARKLSACGSASGGTEVPHLCRILPRTNCTGSVQQRETTVWSSKSSTLTSSCCRSFRRVHHNRRRCHRSYSSVCSWWFGSQYGWTFCRL